jgi:hypothetical protein
VLAVASPHAEIVATEGAVPIKKRQDAIAADALPCVFDDECIARLADIGKFPDSGDRQRLADGIRKAARIYALGMRKLDAIAVQREIEKLHQAATRREYERAAELRETLSPQALRKLKEREVTPGFVAAELKLPSAASAHDLGGEAVRKRRHVLRPAEEYTEYEAAGLKLPSAQELRDPAKREEACDIVRLFCSVGAELVKGRKRPTGRRSASTWQTVLYAPVPISRQRLKQMAGRKGRKPIKAMRRLGRRETELAFLMNLQLAWLGATGKKSSLAANADRLGPFARMVEQSLKLVGAGRVHVAELINDLNRRRNKLIKQLKNRRRNKLKRRPKI